MIRSRAGAAPSRPPGRSTRNPNRTRVGDQVADLRPEIPLAVRLDQSQQQAADHRAGDRTEPADHHGDETLQGRPHAEHRRDLLVDGEHEVAGNAAERRGARERAQGRRLHIDADEVRGHRLVDDRAQRQPEAGAVESEVDDGGQHQHAGKHHQVIGAQQERTERERSAARERRERVGVARQQQDGRLLELHPDSEARHHRGDAGARRHRGKAQPLDIDAGKRRPGHGRGGDHHRPGAEVHVQERAEIGAQHDRRPVGEVEPAHDAEDQGEAERQQRVGRADHHAVDRVLDEVDHRTTAQCSSFRGAPPISGLPGIGV